MGIINGTSDNDLLIGTPNADVIFGLAGSDRTLGLTGNDTLHGNPGNDTLYGGKGTDLLRGGKGNDLLFGDNESDTLYGDNGNNTLTGGSGRDLFVIGPGSNLITDFVDGEDLIGLGNGLTFDQLDIIQESGETQIQLNGNAIAILRGTPQLSAADFTPLSPLNTPTSPTPPIPPIRSPLVPPTPTPAFTLQILHAADQEAGLPAIADAVNFSAIFNALEDEFPNTLKLTSGDVYIPGPFLQASDEIYGEPGIGDIIINNALGFQAAAFGNHEFDLGTGVVANLINPNPEITGAGIDAEGYLGTAFPYLSANLNFEPDENLSNLVVADGQAPQPNSIAKSVVLEVGGERIGVVGATTPTLRRISSPGNVEILPSDSADIAALASEIQASVDALTATGINKVVLLAHMQQISIERQLAQLLTDVDVVIAGGSNTILANPDDPLRAGDTAVDPYPNQLTSASGEPVVLVNTDGNYRYVGRLVAEFDENGIITNILDASGVYATDEAGVNRVYGRDVDPKEVADPTVVAVTDAIAEVVLEKDRNLFGRTEVFLEGRRGEVRTQETNLGNLTADANLFIAQQYDPTTTVSLKNGGGIRDNIGTAFVPPGGTGEPVLSPPAANPLVNKEEGDISQLDIENALRFNNALSLVTVTAEGLKQILEHGVSGVAPNATPGSFPQVGGISFSFDATQPVGERIRNLAILNDEGSVVDVVVQDGQIQGDASRSIRMVTLSFLAEGGDGYPFPALSTNRLDLADLPIPDGGINTATFANPGTEQDALAEYLAATFPADGDVTTPVFDVEDVDPEFDLRIQNLQFRDDTVLEGGSEPTFNEVASGTGADALTGTPEADRFIFTNLNQAGDTINNFDPANDIFRFSAAGFSGLTVGTTPTLTQGTTSVGNAAQFLYSNGVLSFDPDGTGATLPSAIATLTGMPSLMANQLTVL